MTTDPLLICESCAVRHALGRSIRLLAGDCQVCGARGQLYILDPTPENERLVDAAGEERERQVDAEALQEVTIIPGKTLMELNSNPFPRWSREWIAWEEAGMDFGLGCDPELRRRAERKAQAAFRSPASGTRKAVAA